MEGKFGTLRSGDLIDGKYWYTSATVRGSVQLTEQPIGTAIQIAYEISKFHSEMQDLQMLRRLHYGEKNMNKRENSYF